MNRTRVPVGPLSPVLYEPVVRAALAEDFGLGGDVTSEATIAEDVVASGLLVAREAGRLAGLDAALYAFRLLDPELRVEVFACDADALSAGSPIAAVAGRARALLGAERTALNLLSHLSGIASATARYVAACGSARCTVTETRKTLPGLRALQKYAVRTGGGSNHRFRLDDAILVKDNHVALAGGIEPALSYARARAGHLMKVEIEVDTLEQFDRVLAHGGADAVLLDNFLLAHLHEAVRRRAERDMASAITLEASGGITLETIGPIAASGVDVISVGALTHSVVALDIGLDIRLDKA